MTGVDLTCCSSPSPIARLGRDETIPPQHKIAELFSPTCRESDLSSFDIRVQVFSSLFHEHSLQPACSMANNAGYRTDWAGDEEKYENGKLSSDVEDGQTRVTAGHKGKGNPFGDETNSEVKYAVMAWW